MNFEAEIFFFDPDLGERHEKTVTLHSDYLGLFTQMKEAGFRFEAEILNASEVSVVVANDIKTASISVVEPGSVASALITMLEAQPWNQPVTS